MNEIIKRNSAWIDQTWEKLCQKLEATAVRNRSKLPYLTENGVYDDMRTKDVAWWTNGFFGGLMWLMFAGSGKQIFADVAKEQEAMLDDCIDHLDELHHDVGFMWHLTSGASHALTGDNRSRTRNLLAGMLLASRFTVKSDFIRAWNFEETEELSIIDTMMNLPLLYWLSKQFDDPNYTNIAMIHADMAMRDHVRPDGSVRHIVEHDPARPNSFKGVQKGQGYSSESAWSRGCSWAVYGFALSYMHTQKKEYLDTAKRCADYFIEQTQKTGWLPRLDFCQPESPLYYDSTAGAVAACGMIEIARILGGSEGDKYLTAALNILKTMEENWCNWNVDEDSVLQMGSESYVKGIHRHIVYGDFFFAEAVLKLKGNDFLIW